MQENNKKIVKKEKQELEKSILGGKITQGKDFQTGKMIDLPDDGRDYSKELEKTRAMGVPDIQKLEYTDPFTKKKTIIEIDRTGTTEEKLGAIMLSPNATRDQRDAMMSMYIFERGKESASFIADIFRYQGQHTKITQHFKTQMRRDYEIIIDALVDFMSTSGQSIIDVLMPGTKLTDIEEEALTYITADKKKHKTLVEFAHEKFKDKAEAALFMTAVRFQSEAALLMDKVKEVLEMRMKDSRYGQYISKSGKIFDTSSPTFVQDVVDDIQHEKQKVEEQNKKNEDEEKKSTTS